MAAAAGGLFGASEDRLFSAAILVVFAALAWITGGRAGTCRRADKAVLARCYCGAREQPMPRSMVTPEGVSSWQGGRSAATRVGGAGGG